MLTELLNAVDHIVVCFPFKCKTNKQTQNRTPHRTQKFNLFICIFTAQPFAANVLIQFFERLVLAEGCNHKYQAFWHPFGSLRITKNVKQILMKDCGLVGYSQSDIEF